MSNLRGSAYLLASLAAIAFGASHLIPPLPRAQYRGVSGADVPKNIAGFQSRGEDEISPPVRAALSAADLVSRTYQSKKGQIISFTMISGTDRSALHDPRSCLTGGGWRTENDHTETIPGTRVSARVCRIVQESTHQANEMMYLYVVNDRIITQVTQIRYQMLLSTLVGHRGTPTVFIRFMRPLQNTIEADTADREEFLMFATQTWNTLQLDRRQQGLSGTIAPR